MFARWKNGKRDKDVWLDSLTRGSELHDLYAGHAASVPRRRAPAGSKERRCLAADRSQRRASANSSAKCRAATAQILGEGDPGNSWPMSNCFVDAESEDATTSTPIGFEVSFGRPLEDDGEPLAQAEAVGRSISERG